MSSEHKIERYDKIWISLFVFSIITITSIYIINYFFSDEFSVFDSISLFLYTMVPGILVITSIWSIKSGISKDIPKKPLILLTLSFVSWFIAEQLWMLYDYVFNIEPWPSAADIFYTIAPILMLISLTLYLKSFKSKITKKNILIAVIISSSLLIPTAIITFQDNEGSTIFELIILITYPVADALVLIPTILIIFLIFHNKKNSFWVMMLVGIVVLIAADTLFLFFVLIDEYYDNHPIDLLWLLSYTIWTFTLLRSINNSKKSYSSEIESEDYKKFETELLSRYGITSFLIIINVLVIVVLFGIHYVLTTQPDFEFLEFFTAFLVMMMIIFSGMIILLNKSMYKNLENRTNALLKTQSELIKAERFSAIGTLASRLAHDLRNPLGIIMTSNSIINELTDEEKIKKHNELIERSLKRMEHQINNVLDFVRVRPLKLEKYSIQELIDEIINQIKIPNGIIFKKPETSPKILCDKEQFLIVLYNIVFNAVQKISDHGTISIIYEEDEFYNILKIQDSGDPIPEEIKGEIFEPLFTTKSRGTGLGLASCKQIIKEHKGVITVENNPTTFIIKIPKEEK